MTRINFASLSADSHQDGNPGGIYTLGVALAKSFSAPWPVKTDIVGGEITVAPRLTGVINDDSQVFTRIALYDFPDGKVEVTSEKQGDPGFQSFKHAIEFMFASFSKAIQVELSKYLNAGAVFFVEMGDGQFGVVGSSKNPVYAKQSFKSGKKGGDPRGFTMKGDSDGNMWDILPLSSAVAAALNFEPIPGSVSPA